MIINHQQIKGLLTYATAAYSRNMAFMIESEKNKILNFTKHKNGLDILVTYLIYLIYLICWLVQVDSYKPFYYRLIRYILELNLLIHINSCNIEISLTFNSLIRVLVSNVRLELNIIK